MVGRRPRVYAPPDADGTCRCGFLVVALRGDEGASWVMALARLELGRAAVVRDVVVQRRAYRRGAPRRSHGPRERMDIDDDPASTACSSGSPGTRRRAPTGAGMARD